MSTPIVKPAYQADAVFQPGRGGVFAAPAGSEPPTLAEMRAYLSSADRSAGIGEVWAPIGYTSADELPQIGMETEGGEKMGVWEDPNFRISPITTAESVVVTPVQWSLETIRRRYGAGAKLDGATGQVIKPATYEPVEEALMVVYIDGPRFLANHFWRAATAPEGEVKAETDAFLGAPIKYTPLGMEGKDGMGALLGYHLQTADADGDGIPDSLDTDPAPAG